MSKKKIKDLTDKEKSLICDRYSKKWDCTSCPFYFGSSDFESFCYLNVTKEFLNQKIEVEEDD